MKNTSNDFKLILQYNLYILCVLFGQAIGDWILSEPPLAYTPADFIIAIIIATIVMYIATNSS